MARGIFSKKFLSRVWSKHYALMSVTVIMLLGVLAYSSIGGRPTTNENTDQAQIFDFTTENNAHIKDNPKVETLSENIVRLEAEIAEDTYNTFEELVSLAGLYEKSDRKTDALQTYKRILATEPDNSLFNYDQATIEAYKQQVKEKISSLEGASHE